MPTRRLLRRLQFSESGSGWKVVRGRQSMVQQENMETLTNELSGVVSVNPTDRGS